MNSYKERYELLKKDIMAIKNNKQMLEQTLEAEYMKLEIEKFKVRDLGFELEWLKIERDDIIKNKEKIINVLSDILMTALLVATFALAVFAYKIVSPIEILKIILTLIEIISGCGVTMAFGMYGIKNIILSLKRKNANKNANKPEYLALTKQINAKSKELEETKTISNQIEEEIDDITKDINTQNELLSSKQNEIVQLYEEILTTTLETPISAKVPEVSEKIQSEEKPKTRTKKGIGHKR